jgi:hypothetical protein
MGRKLGEAGTSVTGEPAKWGRNSWQSVAPARRGHDSANAQAGPGSSLPTALPRFFSYFTLKLVLLVALPSVVVTAILPVFAPVGTSAVTCVSECTAKVVAATPSKLTAVVCVRALPVIVTEVPTGPLAGVNPVMAGSTLNVCALVSVVAPVVTVTGPDCAPAGTVAVI